MRSYNIKLLKFSPVQNAKIIQKKYKGLITQCLVSLAFFIFPPFFIFFLAFVLEFFLAFFIVPYVFPCVFYTNM